MGWVQPKTDWKVQIVNGEYVGDYFDWNDFNRIKNNLEYLYEIAIEMYQFFEFNKLGEDRTCEDYFFADEINKLEENLNSLNENTFNLQYGENPTYYDNGKIMDFEELNRIESAILDLEKRLKAEYKKLRKFQWCFGKGVDF